MHNSIAAISNLKADKCSALKSVSAILITGKAEAQRKIVIPNAK